MSRHLAKSHGLQNRIKKIMQSNDDVGKVAAASTHVVAYAVEEFLDELVRGAVAVSVEHGNGKLLSPAHIKAHVGRDATFDFCKDIVAKAPDVGEEGGAKSSRAAATKKTRRRGDSEADPKKKKKKKKKKKAASETSEEDAIEEDNDDDDDDDDEFGLLDIKNGDHAEQEEEEDNDDENYDDF